MATVDAEAIARSLAERGYQVNRYVYPPGTYFPEHTHPFDKIVVVLDGRFRLTLKGEAMAPGIGEEVAVARGTLHSAETVGNEPAVCFDAVKL